MRRILVCVIILLSAVSWGVARADDPESGPKVGEVAKGFEVELVTGDDAGKTLDILKTLKDKPVLLIFVSEMTRPAFGLLKLLDKYGRLRQPEGLEVLIVRVTDDVAGAARQSKVHFDLYDIKSTAGVARGGPLPLDPERVKAGGEMAGIQPSRPGAWFGWGGVRLLRVQ